jgi:hypothetical protein
LFCFFVSAFDSFSSLHFGVAMNVIRMRWEEKINCACLWFWF